MLKSIRFLPSLKPIHGFLAEFVSLAMSRLHEHLWTNTKKTHNMTNKNSSGVDNVSSINEHRWKRTSTLNYERTRSDSTLVHQRICARSYRIAFAIPGHFFQRIRALISSNANKHNHFCSFACVRIWVRLHRFTNAGSCSFAIVPIRSHLFADVHDVWTWLLKFPLFNCSPKFHLMFAHLRPGRRTLTNMNERNCLMFTERYTFGKWT